jgi:hypothetical protein
VAACFFFWHQVADQRSPRACGGSPPNLTPTQFKTLVAPRMRGFALVLHQHVTDRPGRPAHAGVRPDMERFESIAAWSPRACGGSPPHHRDRAQRHQVAPRMRGFARQLGDAQDDRRGRPAHAGVRPRLPSTTASRARSPRACGGSPNRRDAHEELYEVAPRMRGFAPPGRLQPGRADGRPAHAGVRPRPRPTGHPFEGSPRACGGSPVPQPSPALARLVAPRMRGFADDRHIVLQSLGAARMEVPFQR